jgi:pyruvate-ferredoxin/flavodoxin oxidoreductase
MDLPLAIRRYKDQGPPYSRLSRFYHDTAYFYQSGEEQEFTADPFQAVSAIPAASAGLTDVAGQRSHIPVFQPETCTGCGKCFVYCPHSALPPLAIGLEPFIKGVMEIAAGRGVPLTPLIPAVKNLARIAGQEIQVAEGKTGRIADFLPAAFERLAAQMKLPVEKEENLRNAFASFMEIAGELPVSVTDAFFSIPELRENGAGELFTLAVDPYACTGCGLCARLCEEEALVMQPQTPELLEKQLSAFSLWEQLPDTSSDTITRLVSDENYDPFAAILLSRNFYQSMAGGGLSESGAPAKALLHLATALAESVVQPRMAKQSREIGELIDSLSANIHSKLSEALPSQHFDSLLKALEEAGGRKTPFDEIVGSLGAESHLRLVDTGALQRQVELVNDLKELRRLLTEGSTGNGRARFGAVIPAGSFSWADRFPYNPFLSPVLLNGEGASAGLLTGLFQGYLRHALDNIRLLRRARLEAKGKYRPEQHAREITSLQWEDLDDLEKGLVPPLLLIGDKTLLDREYLPSLSDLLASPWPVKVFVMDDGLASPQGNPAAHFSRRSALLFPALALRNAYVMYGSLDNPKLLFDGLLKGLAGSRPALFHLFAPDQKQHDIQPNDWPKLASLAQETRAFPAFRFDPGRASGSLFAGISIEGNPSEEDAWHSLSLPCREGEVNYTRTYADWLFTQKEWISHFQPVELLEGSAVRLPEYLALDEPACKGKTPVILTVDEEGNLFQYSASPAVVAATRAALSWWQTLQEMVGVAKNVPEEIRKSIEGEISEKYEKAIADLRAGYEDKLGRQESELMANVKIRLREKLLALAGKQ